MGRHCSNAHAATFVSDVDFEGDMFAKRLPQSSRKQETGEPTKPQLWFSKPVWAHHRLINQQGAYKTLPKEEAYYEQDTCCKDG